MKYLLFPTLLELGLAGCSPSLKSETHPSPASPDVAATLPTAASAASAIAAPPAAADSVPTPALATSSPQAAASRGVAYQGKMNLAVENLEQARASLNQCPPAPVG